MFKNIKKLIVTEVVIKNNLIFHSEVFDKKF